MGSAGGLREGNTIDSGDLTWNVMMKKTANCISATPMEEPDHLQGKSQPTAKVAMTPNSSIFSASSPPRQARATTTTHIPNPTHRPTLYRSPRSTPRPPSILSLPRRIHMLHVPNPTAHCRIRARFTHPSSIGNRAKTPDGLVGVAVGRSGRAGNR